MHTSRAVFKLSFLRGGVKWCLPQSATAHRFVWVLQMMSSVRMRMTKRGNPGFSCYVSHAAGMQPIEPGTPTQHSCTVLHLFSVQWWEKVLSKQGKWQKSCEFFKHI